MVSTGQFYISSDFLMGSPSCLPAVNPEVDPNRLVENVPLSGGLMPTLNTGDTSTFFLWVLSTEAAQAATVPKKGVTEETAWNVSDQREENVLNGQRGQNGQTETALLSLSAASARRWTTEVGSVSDKESLKRCAKWPV